MAAVPRGVSTGFREKTCTHPKDYRSYDVGSPWHLGKSRIQGRTGVKKSRSTTMCLIMVHKSWHPSQPPTEVVAMAKPAQTWQGASSRYALLVLKRKQHISGDIWERGIHKGILEFDVSATAVKGLFIAACFRPVK